MDERCLALAEEFCTTQYVHAGTENLHSLQRLLRSIFSQRRCPEEGLSDLMIENLLTQLALMDANNFAGHIGGGEREGRVVAPLVRRRTFGLSHGIGRSGNLTEAQPKAAGSSVMYQVTNVLLLDLLRLSGAKSFRAALCVPLATGMTIALVLRAIEQMRRMECEGEPPRVVVWPRIDQKTALKCIDAAGFEAEVVPLRAAAPSCCRSAAFVNASTRHPFFLQVHEDDIAEAVERVGGANRVLCILSTTSCFAPRLPDDVLRIGRYAKRCGIPYVVNNAYGVQSPAIMRRLEAAMQEGLVDYVVQSGDKNFLVPVGGAVVASPSEEKVSRVAALYAGRASSAPILDLFVTALYLGRKGMQELWTTRAHVLQYMRERLRVFALERHEILLCEEMQKVTTRPQEDHSFPPARSATPHDSTDLDVDILLQVGEEEEEKEAGCRRRSALSKRGTDERNEISLAVTMHRFGMEGVVGAFPAPPVRSPHELLLVGDEKGSGAAPQRVRLSGLSPECCRSRDVACREFGAKLFRSRVTGPRVILPAREKETIVVDKHRFRSYGCHSDEGPFCPLLVMACGIGMQKQEVDELIQVLGKLWPITKPK